MGKGKTKGEILGVYMLVKRGRGSVKVVCDERGKMGD